MALIKCSECGKEFSDKAASCPNCGCPIEAAKGQSAERKADAPKPVYTDIATGQPVQPNEGKKEKKKGGLGKKILIGVVVVIALAVIGSLFGGDSDSKTAKSTPAEKPAARKIQVPAMSEAFDKGFEAGRKDNKTALSFYEQGYKNDNCPYCMAGLALYYSDGGGGSKKDTKKALELAKKSSDMNCPYGSFILGVFYLLPEIGTPQNAESGVKYIDKAIETGLAGGEDTKRFAAGAARYLAEIYEKGNATLSKDYDKAIEYYKKALSSNFYNEKLTAEINNQIYNLEHRPDFTGEPYALLKAYTTNEIEADSKYKGKTIRLTGRIDSIGKDIMDSMYLTFVMPNRYEFRSVQCFFSDKHAEELGKLRKGNKIVVQGRIDGLMGNVLIKDCWLVH